MVTVNREEGMAILFFLQLRELVREGKKMAATIPVLISFTLSQFFTLD